MKLQMLPPPCMQMKKQNQLARTGIKSPPVRSKYELETGVRELQGLACPYSSRVKKTAE